MRPLTDDVLREYAEHMVQDSEIGSMARELLGLRAFRAELVSMADWEYMLAEVKALREVHRRAALLLAGDMSAEALAEACAMVEKAKTAKMGET